jgi:two-component system sensor histidine kinase EvgS
MASPLPKASTRIGLFAMLLSVLVLSLFGSLVSADRAISAAGSEAVALDARSAALVAERELRLHAEALGGMFGPLLPRTGEVRAGDTTAVPGEFSAAWVLDGAGRIVWTRSRDNAVVDSALVASTARSAARGPSPVVRAGAADGILLGVGLSHRGQPLGTAVGLLRGSRVLASLRDSTVARPWIALKSGGRIFALAGRRDSAAQMSAAATIRLAGDPIQVELAHEQTGRALRITLWLLGVIALAALLAGLARERVHAASLAGRTTELERLYQEVARSNRMKSEFLANVSHELRTPLNAVVGFVEMLREGVYGDLSPRQALPVDRIAASATHLRQLVDRLLDIAKIAAGRLEVHTEPLVLRPFVLNVASEMESLISERGLALSIGVGPTLPRIRTDQTHLRQILINLIGNAVKYTPSGNISVRGRVVGNGESPAEPGEPKIGTPPDAQKSWVALQVADTGVGIAHADQERIFDEFEQVNAGARTDSARRGTGLGLAISRRLARLIGGDLTVMSEVGRGSVFTVWLPLEETKPD